MSVSFQELAKEKSLPRWMTKHSVFKSIGKIEKVFPNIGLPNGSEPCDIVGNFAIEEAKTLLDIIASEIRAPLEVFAKGSYIGECELIGQLDAMFCDRMDDFITYSKGEIVLKLPDDISVCNDTVKYPKGMPLFDLYCQCRRSFADHAWLMPQLEKLPGYKNFVSNNVSSDASSIVFASDGIDGLWDIATMSMRGISSCVRWGGKYKLTLIGSIADPFTGVIYLTSGKNIAKYGTRMIKRFVVRFVIDGNKEKPYLLIDRMYPSLSDNVLKAFTGFLHSKTGLDVHFGPNIPRTIINNSYIPRKPINDQLSEKTLTYRDTKIPIGKMQSKVSERKDINTKIKEHNLAFRLKSATSVAECIATVENQNNMGAVRWLRTADFQYLIGEYATSLVANLAKRCPLKPDQSSSDHIKQMAYMFFSDKKQISKVENEKFLRAIRKYYAPQAAAKTDLTMTTLKPMFAFITDAIKKTMKAELIGIINPVKTKKQKIKPAQRAI
jgi:hypothetical protein